MDSFNVNVPVYAPTLEEFREVVDADGSFRISRLELVIGSPPVVDRGDEPGAVGRVVSNNERSILGALVDTHVGKALDVEPRNVHMSSWPKCASPMSCAHSRSKVT